MCLPSNIWRLREEVCIKRKLPLCLRVMCMPETSKLFSFHYISEAVLDQCKMSFLICSFSIEFSAWLKEVCAIGYFLADFQCRRLVLLTQSSEPVQYIYVYMFAHAFTISRVVLQHTKIYGKNPCHIFTFSY